MSIVGVSVIDPTFTRSADVMSNSRILFTCRPLSGHFDPLLPLAAAARASGHTVAFASGDPVVGRARDAGFTAFEAGTADTFRAEWAPRFPGFTTLVGDAQRKFFFTEISPTWSWHREPSISSRSCRRGIQTWSCTRWPSWLRRW